MTLGRPPVRGRLEDSGATVSTCPSAGVESIEASVDHGNLLIDLTDSHAEVVAGSPLEIDGQLLKMHPNILETLSVVQPNVLVDNLLHGF
jgi:hypothetical protein